VRFTEDPLTEELYLRGRAASELAHDGDYAGYLAALGRVDNFRDHGRSHPQSARGWLAAAGPGIRRAGTMPLGETRRGRDVAPTVAYLLGLPADTGSRIGSPIDEIIDPAARDTFASSAASSPCAAEPECPTCFGSRGPAPGTCSAPPLHPRPTPNGRIGT
jgi:hypothetical protein